MYTVGCGGNALPDIAIIEVSPRDGLQNESAILATEDKRILIARAIAAGIGRVEATSFVNPARVPALADAEDVMAGAAAPAARRAGLVLNLRGLERAVAAGVDEATYVVVASDTLGRRNQGQDTAAALAEAGVLARRCAETGTAFNVVIAAAFGCPYEGEVSAGRVGEIARALEAIGVAEIGLADTIGVGTPDAVEDRVARARAAAPEAQLRLHLHDTRRTALANAYAGWRAGVRGFDASIGGFGGCPFAPGASGNVATEDLAWMFERMGVRTGLDIDALSATARWLGERLGKAPPGAISRVGVFPPARMAA